MNIINILEIDNIIFLYKAQIEIYEKKEKLHKEFYDRLNVYNRYKLRLEPINRHSFYLQTFFLLGSIENIRKRRIQDIRIKAKNDKVFYIKHMIRKIIFSFISKC